MNSNSDFDQLDALLAHPAELADRGFSDRVSMKTAKLNRTRRRVFLATGLCWLALIVIATSPQAIYTDILTIALTFDIGNIYSFALSQIQILGSFVQQLPFPTLAAGLLSLAAIASMVVRT